MSAGAVSLVKFHISPYTYPPQDRTFFNLFLFLTVNNDIYFRLFNTYLQSFDYCNLSCEYIRFFRSQGTAKPNYLSKNCQTKVVLLCLPDRTSIIQCLWFFHEDVWRYWEMRRKGWLKWYQSIELALRNCRYFLLHRFKEPWFFNGHEHKNKRRLFNAAFLG